MKKLKHILSLLLVITVLAGLMTVGASAATGYQALEAKALSAMGLFRGYDNSGNNFGLDDTLTREQALALLIRMKGEADAAEAWTGALPYSDVSTSGKMLAYIGYGKEKGYTVGIGNEKFGMGRAVNMQEMAIFALRGLGYSDSKSVGDFDWKSGMPFAVTVGVLDSTEVIKPFTRGHAVDILVNTLASNVKGQGYDLLSKLMNDGVVTQAQYDNALAILSAKKVAVTGITLDNSAAKVEVGKAVQLTGIVAPADASNQNVTWTSSESAVAKVDSNGVVTGVKAGTATITVKTVDGGKTAACKVTVTADQKMTKSAVTLRNQTGKSIVEMYITDSALSNYDSEILKANGFKSFAHSKTITREFEFYAGTSFDILLRFSDGTKAEALGLSFENANASACDLTLGTKDAVLSRGGTTLAQVAYEGKVGELDAQSKALTDRYNKAIAHYNALLAQCKTLGLDKDPAFVKGVNDLTDAVNKMGKTIGEGTGILTAAQIKEFTANLNDLDIFMNWMEALI